MGEARLTFLATLRAGLRGAPEAAIEDAVFDYTSHFDVGATKGRTEQEIAAALGNPLALADELRVEMQIERWEKKRSPAAAARIISGIVGLGFLNIALVFIIAPILLLLAFVVIVTVAASIVTGLWLIFAGHTIEPAAGVLPLFLAGAGLIFAAISISALTALGVIALVSGLGRYARLHYRVLSRSKGSAP